MKKSTRVLSLLLVLVMAFALMPTFTFEAKADGTFYGGGAEAGAYTTDTKWYGKDSIKDANNNKRHLLQYARETNGAEPTNRYKLNYTADSIVTTLTSSSRNRYVFLVPYNSGTLYLDRANNNQYNYLGKHIVRDADDANRWWRWDSWSGSDTEWTTDNNVAGFFGQARYDPIIGKQAWDSISKNPTPKWSWVSYEWTGGAKESTGNNFELRIHATADLPAGSTAVLWSANGTRLNDNGDAISSLGTYDFVAHRYVNNGAISTLEFAVAEPKEVVYELNGGTLASAPDAKNIGYVCWSANNKLYSQLHDVLSEEPTKDGYVFVGWECVKNENNATVSGVTIKQTNRAVGNQDKKTGMYVYSVNNQGTALTEGKVYQSVNENGNKTTLTIMGNVVFKAKWIKTTSKIAHVQNNAVKSTEDLKLADFGSYKIVAFDKEKEFATNGEKLDITTKVPTGYLYGGTFKEDYQTVADFNGGTADSFVPKFTEKGETYYIWEVTDEHLQPTVLSTYSKNGGYKVEEVFLVSAVDRNLYQEAGFMLNNNPDNLIKTYENNLYSYILIKSQKDSSATQKANYALLNSKNTTAANAVLSCAQIEVPTSETSVVPYWVTLDGQTVYGVKQCAISYSGSGPALTVSFSAYPTVVKAPAPVRSFAAAPMMLMSTYSMGQEESPAEIPGAPEVPETPDEPDVPVVPDEPETPAVLNVVDGNKEYTVELGDEEVALTPAGENGKFFAGWYADKACTVPADLSKAEDGNTVYAKYVSDSYLQVKYNAVFILLSKSVSLTSAVDSKDYAETGYVISTKNGDDKVVVSKYATTFALQNAKQLFGVEKNAPLMNVDYKLSGPSKNDTVTVTPYLVTADGTTVYGTARTLTYTGLTMKG